jgi:serine/threonine protein kinase
MSLPTSEPLENQRLGDFEIVREIGRGGMGVVYEARQVSLNRTVALKVLAGGPGLNAEAVQRFHREAEAAAKLHHPNIVSVYATGQENGTHFFAMELIEGPSLASVIRQRRQPPAVAAAPGSSWGRPQWRRGQRPAGATAPASASSTGPTPSPLGSDSGNFDQAAQWIAEVADALDYAHKPGGDSSRCQAGQPAPVAGRSAKWSSAQITVGLPVTVRKGQKAARNGLSWGVNARAVNPTAICAEDH